jgi:hypothetical protein
MDKVSRNILEQGAQIDFLLVVTAKRAAGLLADDRQKRLMVGAGIIHASDEMCRPWTRRRKADAEFAGELGIGRRHECGHFLVTCLDEFDLVACPVQRSEDTVDTVARVPEHAPDAPRVKAGNDEITDCLCHGNCLSISWSGYVPTNPRPAALVPLANSGWPKRKAGDTGCAHTVEDPRNFAAKPQFSLLHIS